jgi:FAD synthetase
MSEDPGERARAYLVAVEKAINAAETLNDRDALRIVDYAKRYVADSRYFLETGKPTTALASVAYAEGLLDSLTILGLGDSTGTTR